MKNFSAVVILFCVFILPAVTYGQNYKTKTLKVNKNGNLLVDISYGDIVIKTWNNNELKVRYDLEDYEDEESFSIKAAGNHVRIRSYSGSSSLVEITVPSQFNVEMTTQAGDLTVEGTLSGNISGKTSGGDVNIDKVNGTVEFLTYGGDIKANEIKGTLKILTYGGDMELSNIDGNGTISTQGGNIRINNVSKTVTIKTAGGNIDVNQLNGKTKISTGGGNISIKYVSGSTELKTGGGDIQGGGGKATVDASTGSGNIYLYKINGPVKANSGSGDISVELLNDDADSFIRTNNGNIKLFIPPNAKVTVEVKIRGFGKHYSHDEDDVVQLELNPTSKNVNRSSDNIMATYSFNGGGKKIYLDTSYGDVEIKRAR